MKMFANSAIEDAARVREMGGGSIALLVCSIATVGALFAWRVHVNKRDEAAIPIQAAWRGSMQRNSMGLQGQDAPTE